MLKITGVSVVRRLLYLVPNTARLLTKNDNQSIWNPFISFYDLPQYLDVCRNVNAKNCGQVCGLNAKKALMLYN